MNTQGLTDHEIKLRAEVERLTRLLKHDTDGVGEILKENHDIVARWELCGEEVKALKETNTRLNRRCQEAESAARETVEATEEKGQSLGRGLAGWAAGDWRRKADKLEDEAKELRTDKQTLMTECEVLRAEVELQKGWERLFKTEFPEEVMAHFRSFKERCEKLECQNRDFRDLLKLTVDVLRDDGNYQGTISSIKAIVGKHDTSKGSNE